MLLHSKIKNVFILRDSINADCGGEGQFFLLVIVNDCSRSIHHSSPRPIFFFSFCRLHSF